MLAYKLRNNSRIYETELNNSETIGENELDKNTYKGTAEELINQNLEDINKRIQEIGGDSDE